jgi:hypothetical protein
VRGYFERKRAEKEPYSDGQLAEAIVDKEWGKAKPVARLLIIEIVAEWLGAMARAATERAMRDGMDTIPGMVFYRDRATKVGMRRSSRAATLAELRRYEEELETNATGALAELRKVRNMIARAEEAGCREDEAFWPYLSDSPELPLGEPAARPEASPPP